MFCSSCFVGVGEDEEDIDDDVVVRVWVDLKVEVYER